MSKKEAAEKYFKLGEQKYNKKDYQEAIAGYDKAIELNPKDVRAYYNRGNAKYELKFCNAKGSCRSRAILGLALWLCQNLQRASLYCLR